MLIYSTLLYTGLALQAAALGKQVYDITGREIDIGWIGLVEFLPAAFLVLVTGMVADRFQRKKVAMIGMAGELTSALALMFYARTHPTAVAPIFFITFLYGVSRAFIAPAARSIWPMVAPPGGLPAVVALSSATWTGAAILGPASSGLLYSVDPWVAYAVASGLICIGLLSLTRVKTGQAATVENRERPTLHDALEGLRFIRRTPILLAAISLDLFAVLFGGAIALSSTGSNVLVAAPSWSSNRGRVRSIGFVSSPIISYEIWCAGKNTGNKFSLTGDSTTWRQMGPLPTGYQIKEFWPGNGYYSDNVNFVKAYRPEDNMNYLFVVGSNTKYESGLGNNTVLNTWTRLNLQSHVVDRIINIQSVSPYGGEDYTILHLDDGTLYFAGYNSYMIDPNLPNNGYRTDFTRIK